MVKAERPPEERGLQVLYPLMLLSGAQPVVPLGGFDLDHSSAGPSRKWLVEMRMWLLFLFNYNYLR